MSAWSPSLPPNAWLRWEAASRYFPRDGSDVLEIGCGQGGFAVRLASRYRYVGIDPDGTSLAIARQRLAAHGVHGDLREGDLSTVRDDELFDLVCAFEVIEHMEDDRLAVSAWAAHLRPGGALLVSAPGWSNRFAEWDELAGHYRRYDPSMLETVLTSAGLSDVRAEPYAWPLGYALEAVRNKLAQRRGVDSAGDSLQSKTAASGRLMRLPDGLAAAVPYVLTLPFAKLQHLMRGHGPNILGIGRRQA